MISSKDEGVAAERAGFSAFCVARQAIPWSRPPVRVAPVAVCGAAQPLLRAACNFRLSAGRSSVPEIGEAGAARFYWRCVLVCGVSVPALSLSYSGFELETPAPVGRSAAACAESEANGLRPSGPALKPSEEACREARRLPRTGQTASRSWPTAELGQRLNAFRRVMSQIYHALKLRPYC